tara:strand:+ start:704 stop:1507 length:804 start_codon:yes stop_codon:yes gene_type:complete
MIFLFVATATALTTAAIVGSVGLVAGAGASIYSSWKAGKTAGDANDLARENMSTQAGIAQQQLAWQVEQQKKLDAQKEIYSNYEFTNPYTNIENVFEDLTVNKQQAEFQRQMFQQSQADIMQSLRGTAGASGVAGLAQALAGQGQLASQRAAVSIGQQEQAIAMQERQQAAAIDMAERGGEAQLQQQEMQRQATLLGVEMGGMAGANAAVQQAYANQMAAGSAAVGALSSQAAAQYGMAGQFMQAGTSIAQTSASMYGSYMSGQKID